jgi:hypothetical protein
MEHMVLASSWPGVRNSSRCLCSRTLNNEKKDVNYKPWDSSIIKRSQGSLKYSKIVEYSYEVAVLDKPQTFKIKHLLVPARTVQLSSMRELIFRWLLLINAAEILASRNRNSSKYKSHDFAVDLLKLLQ